MARFFHYKSGEQLAAEAAALGLPIELCERFDPLAQPTQVAGRRVGNRLAIQPMEGCDGTLDGTPDELTYRRYHRFGAGGAKLIWGEATAVVPEAKANPRQLCLYAANQPAFARIVDTCRAAHRETMGNDADLLIGLQLTHSGRYSFQRPIIAVHCPVLDPRTLDKTTGKTAVELPLIDDDSLKRLADAYVAAARLAYQSGFDFVDIKQCHRYLLGELLAAKTRSGPFGGSLQNRARLVLDIVGRLRAEVPGLIVATRFNVYDGIPYTKGPDNVGVPCAFTPPLRTAFGTDERDPLRDDLAEPLALVGMLRAAGVALVNVSMGCPYYNPHVIRPAEYPPIDGYLPPENPLVGVGRHFRIAAAIQQAYLDLPIVGSGYSYLQEYLYAAGAANVAASRVTFVGIGRGALAYPDAPRDVLTTGAVNRKTVCRTFSYCTNLMRSKRHPLGQFPTGCPPFDKEVYQPIWKEAEEGKH